MQTTTQAGLHPSSLTGNKTDLNRADAGATWGMLPRCGWTLAVTKIAATKTDNAAICCCLPRCYGNVRLHCKTPALMQTTNQAGLRPSSLTSNEMDLNQADAGATWGMLPWS